MKVKYEVKSRIKVAFKTIYNHIKLLLSHLHNGFGWVKTFHLQLSPEI